MKKKLPLKVEIVIKRSELTHSLCLFLYRICHKLEDHYIHLGEKVDKMIKDSKDDECKKMKLIIEAPDDVVEYARRIAKCREKKEVNDDTKYKEDIREASLWGQMIGIRRMNINTHILYRSMICIGNAIEVKEDDTIVRRGRQMKMSIDTVIRWFKRNACKDCDYYSPKNNLCQSKKCTTCGCHPYVNWFDRHFCEAYKAETED